MAFTWVAAGDQHTICAAGKSFEHEGGVQPPGAHQADQADIRWIFHPRGTGQVRCPVAAPVAGEADDHGFECFVMS